MVVEETSSMALETKLVLFHAIQQIMRLSDYNFYRHRPTVEDISELVNEFNSKYPLDKENYDASIDLVDVYRSNTVYKNVYIKVNFINSAYKTTIGDTMGVSKQIFNKGGQIDQALTPHKTNYEVIDDIKTYVVLNPDINDNEQTRNNYSFATKYCHCHKPNSFFIWDQFVDYSLREFSKLNKGFTVRGSLKNYEIFHETMLNFTRWIGGENLCHSEIDRFLWLLGKVSKQSITCIGRKSKDREGKCRKIKLIDEEIEFKYDETKSIGYVRCSECSSQTRFPFFYLKAYKKYRVKRK